MSRSAAGAWHEAGHAVMAWHVGATVPHIGDKICAVSYPDTATADHKRMVLMAGMIAQAMGTRAAWRDVYFGEALAASRGEGHTDLEKIDMLGGWDEGLEREVRRVLKAKWAEVKEMKDKIKSLPGTGVVPWDVARHDIPTLPRDVLDALEEGRQAVFEDGVWKVAA